MPLKLPPRPFCLLQVLFAATQTVQLIFVAALKLFGTREQLLRAETAFADTADWASSLEAVLVAQGVVLGSLCTDTTEVTEACGAAEALGQQAAG